MPNIITIHAKREFSLLDVETQFRANAIQASEAIQSPVTKPNDTQTVPNEVHLLVDWDVFRNELEFE
jgi:hypothetical protein